MCSKDSCIATVGQPGMLELWHVLKVDAVNAHDGCRHTRNRTWLTSFCCTEASSSALDFNQQSRRAGSPLGTRIYLFKPGAIFDRRSAHGTDTDQSDRRRRRAWGGRQGFSSV